MKLASDLRKFFEKKSVFVALTIFALAVAIGYHGYSTEFMLTKIGATAPQVWGKARGIRSDDWGVNFPLEVSQMRSTPRMPAFNPYVSGGSYVDVGFPYVPVAQWETLFKPYLWGYFLDLDTGLSWQWCFQALVVILGAFLFLRTVIGVAIFESWVIALFLYFNPFLQFWALAGSLFIGYGFLAMTLIYWAALQPLKSRRFWLATVLLAYVAAACAMNMYPPYAVPVGIVILSFGIAHALQKPKLWLAAGVALGVVATLIVAFYLKHREVIEVMRNSVYPGARYSVGGGETLRAFFSNHLYSLRHGHPPDVGKNICEAANFYHFIPLLPALLLSGWKSRSAKQKNLIVTFLVPTLILMTFSLVGFPRLLAGVTGLFASTEARVMVGFGLIMPVFLGLWTITKRDSTHKWIWAVLFCALLVVSISVVEPEALANDRTAVWTYVSMVVALALVALKPRVYLAILLLYALVGTAYFNPISVRGTAHAIEQSPLIQKLELAANAGKTLLALDDNVLANVGRMVPMKSYGGTLSYPNPTWIEMIDPSKVHSETWNRYATITLSSSHTESTMRLLAPDQYEVDVKNLINHFPNSDSYYILNSTNGKYTF